MELFLPNDLSLPRPSFEPVTDTAVLSEIRAVLQSYEGGGKPGAIERFSGPNVITQNYRVQLDGRTLLIKSREGSSEEQRLLAQAQQAERLSSKGVPVPREGRTAQNDLLVIRGERRWVAYGFQEGDYFKGSPAEFFSAAKG